MTEVKVGWTGESYLEGWRVAFNNPKATELRITIPAGRECVVVDLPTADDPEFEVETIYVIRRKPAQEGTK